jgi:HEAT repeat protein
MALCAIWPGSQVAFAKAALAARDSRWRLRAASAVAIARMSVDRCAQRDALARLLRDADWRVREYAVSSIVVFDPCSLETLQRLVEASHDVHRVVQMFSLNAIAKVKCHDPLSVRILLEKLEHGQPEIRLFAKDALDSMGPRAVPPILSMIGEEPNPARQLKLIATLAELPRIPRDQEAALLPILERNRENESFMDHGMCVLWKMGPRTRESALLAATAMADGVESFYSFAILGQIGSYAIPFLISRLKSCTEEHVEQTIALALRKLPPDSSPALRAFENDDNPRVRSVLRRVLSRR